MEGDAPPIPYSPLSAGGHFSEPKGRLTRQELLPLDLN